ncbi:MAG: histidinol-phosphate transaminase [Candidatus Methanoplasma sp.]|jgi:histidinol-phosphate aminotransferase|nr:histidinol-phosphate transaminase [Candidatus Methanoplasma sp.]
MASRDVMRSTARGFGRYYNPDAGGALRMDTNTNALGPNPAAERYLREARPDINGYPNTYSDGLRDALASLYGLERENFVAGAGSDEMLDVCMKTFSDWGDACAVPVPSYSLYNYFIAANGGRAVESDLTPDFQLDVDGIARSGAKMAIAPSPNNPTGNAFRRRDVEDLLSRFEGVLVVDEAYGEYAGGSMIPRVREFDNLVVLRTFSKAYAMAGLRVGYAAACGDLADMMNSVKIPYSLNVLSEGAAVAALGDQGFIERSRRMVSEERPRLSAGLRRLGFEPFPSDANFVLARSPVDHAALVGGLKERGVMIRDFGSKRRTEGCVRMTVGTAEMNALVLDRIADAMEGMA